MTWMLLIITFAVVLTMAVSVHRAAEDMKELLCDCAYCEFESAVIIPFPVSASAAPTTASAC